MKPDEVPAEVPAEALRAVAEALYRAYDSEYGAGHLSWKDFTGQARELLQVAVPHIKRQARAAMGDGLIETFQAMREDGENDMRTVIAHVRDAMRGDSDDA